MRIVGLSALAAVAAASLAAGRLAERVVNRTHASPARNPSSAATALHESAIVVDLHADSLLWGRNLLERSSVGHVDVPRLAEGGVALQVFTAVTRFPASAGLVDTDPRWPDLVTLLVAGQGWPPRTYWSLTERALHQGEALRRFADLSAGALQTISNRQELEALLAARRSGREVIGALFGLEGAHALEGDPGRLETLFDAGVRVIGLVHFFDNEFAGSAHGLERGGLTALGRRLVSDMEARGVLVDLAHASPATIEDVLAIATKPPIVSHTGVRGTCDNARNLSDSELRAIAEKGGVVGIGYWETAVCGETVEAIARAIAHAARIAGEDHVALGSDFDGAVATPFDTASLPLVTDALLRAGLDERAIRKILGENAIRVLAAVLP